MTVLFERVVIDWLGEASLSAVARRHRLVVIVSRPGGFNRELIVAGLAEALTSVSRRSGQLGP